MPSTVKTINLFTAMLCHAMVLYCWMIGLILDSGLHTKVSSEVFVLSLLIHTIGWHTPKLLRGLRDTL